MGQEVLNLLGPKGPRGSVLLAPILASRCFFRRPEHDEALFLDFLDFCQIQGFPTFSQFVDFPDLSDFSPTKDFWDLPRSQNDPRMIPGSRNIVQCFFAILGLHVSTATVESTLAPKYLFSRNLSISVFSRKGPNVRFQASILDIWPNGGSLRSLNPCFGSFQTSSCAARILAS